MPGILTASTNIDTYIDQLSLEANLVTQILKKTKKIYNKSKGNHSFWQKTYPLGNPNPKNSQAWLDQKNIIYLNNVYTSVMENTIQVIVEFQNQPYMHPDLVNQRVIFTAVNKSGRAIVKSEQSDNTPPLLIHDFTCQLTSHDHQATPFGQLHTAYGKNLSITGLLPYPFNKCQSEQN